MKNKLLLFKFILLLLVINCFISNNVLSQQDYRDSCLRYIWPHDPGNGYYNIDSVMYDTCICGDIFEYKRKTGRFPFNHFYAT